VGGNDSLYNNGEGVMIGGMGNDQAESGAGRNVMFGDNGRVVFINDRWNLIETIDIAFGGDDTLIAGAAANYMLGGPGSDVFHGNLSKDVMVGDYGAIYIAPETGQANNVTRFGMGGNRPDLITRTLENLYSWTDSLAVPDRIVIGSLGGSRGALFTVSEERGEDATGNRIQLGTSAPAIAISGHDDGLSDYAAGESGNRVVMRRNDGLSDSGEIYPGGTTGGTQAGTQSNDAATRGTPAESSQEDPAQVDGEQAGDVQAVQDTQAGAAQEEVHAQGRPDEDEAAVREGEPLVATDTAALAAGVAVLGLAGALGATGGNGTVVFNSKTNAWETKTNRKRGLRVTLAASPLTEAVSEDE
jgi:large repetitive protein